MGPNATKPENHPMRLLQNEVKPWERFYYFIFMWLILLVLIIVSINMMRNDELFWVPLLLTLVMVCVAAVSVTVVAVVLGDACQDIIYTSRFIESVVVLEETSEKCKKFTKEIAKDIENELNIYRDNSYKKLKDLKRRIYDYKPTVWKYPNGTRGYPDWFSTEIDFFNKVKGLRENQARKIPNNILSIRELLTDFEDSCPARRQKIDFDTRSCVRAFCENDCILMPVTLQLISTLIAAGLIIRCLIIYIRTRRYVLPREECPRALSPSERFRIWLARKRYEIIKSVHEEPPFKTLRRGIRTGYLCTKRTARKKFSRMRNCKESVEQKLEAVKDRRGKSKMCKPIDFYMTKYDPIIGDHSTKLCTECRTDSDRKNCNICSPHYITTPPLTAKFQAELYRRTRQPCPPVPSSHTPEEWYPILKPTFTEIRPTCKEKEKKPKRWSNTPVLLRSPTVSDTTICLSSKDLAKPLPTAPPISYSPNQSHHNMEKIYTIPTPVKPKSVLKKRTDSYPKSEPSSPASSVRYRSPLLVNSIRKQSVDTYPTGVKTDSATPPIAASIPENSLIDKVMDKEGNSSPPPNKPGELSPCRLDLMERNKTETEVPSYNPSVESDDVAKEHEQEVRRAEDEEVCCGYTEEVDNGCEDMKTPSEEPSFDEGTPSVAYTASTSHVYHSAMLQSTPGSPGVVSTKIKRSIFRRSKAKSDVVPPGGQESQPKQSKGKTSEQPSEVSAFATYRVTDFTRDRALTQKQKKRLTIFLKVPADSHPDDQTNQQSPQNDNS